MTVVKKWLTSTYEYPPTSSGIKLQHFSLTQSGTSAPVSVVKYNSLGGTITWTRTSAGLFVGTSAGLFVGGSAKCSLLVVNINLIISAVVTDANTLTIQTVNDGDLSGHDFIILVNP